MLQMRAKHTSIVYHTTKTFTLFSSSRRWEYGNGLCSGLEWGYGHSRISCGESVAQIQQTWHE